MPVIVNHLNEINAKGVKYFVYSCVSDKGEGVQLFLNAAQEDEYGGTLRKALAERSDVQSMFSGREQVTIAFNQRGRLEGVN